MAKTDQKKTKAHPELGEMDITVTEFGEIKGSLNIDKINNFLNKNVNDKKLSKDQVDKDSN